jgi:hypothetical protein
MRIPISGSFRYVRVLLLYLSVAVANEADESWAMKTRFQHCDMSVPNTDPKGSTTYYHAYSDQIVKAEQFVRSL